MYIFIEGDMLKVNFYNVDDIEDSKLKFAVIVARYNDKWIFVRHKERKTWEIPGGHREVGESVKDAGARELFEETGAIGFRMEYICIYSVLKEGQEESYGALFYSDVKELGKLPESEIGEIGFFEEMPEELTYPLIQPHLYKKVLVLM